MLLLFCVFASAVYLKAQAPVYQYRPQVVQKIKTPVLQLRPDLVAEHQSNVLINGKRYMNVRVRNIGNVQAAASTLVARFHWRVDYESWSQVTKEFPWQLGLIDAGGSRTICIPVPDDIIHSNEGYGSTNVSIRLTADGPQQIAELSETNNAADLSLPILH